MDELSKCYSQDCQQSLEGGDTDRPDHPGCRFLDSNGFCFAHGAAQTWCRDNARRLVGCCGVLQCVAVCCSVLQCVYTHTLSIQPDVCCSVLQCVAVCIHTHTLYSPLWTVCVYASGVYTHTHTNTHISLYTHTHIHTHTQACIH